MTRDFITVAPNRFALFVAMIAACALAPASAVAGTITVNNSVDNSTNCSLREAVTVANSDVNALGCTDSGGGLDDTITFSSSGIDPVLTIVPAGNADDNLTGDIDIEAAPATEGTLTILGLGQANTTIEGGVGAALGPDRLFDHEDGTLTFQDLTLADGDSTGVEPGGAIRSDNDGSPDILNLTDVTLEGNVSGGAGGAVQFANGTLNVLRSTFSGNDASTNGGGLNVAGASATNITDSTFDQNSAFGNPGIGGGLAVSGGGTDLNMQGGVVSNNDTGVANMNNRGAGLYFSASGPVGSVNGTTFTGNDNEAGFGGGVGTGGGTLAVTGATIDGNEASVGGGISASTPVQITDTAFTNNTAISAAALPAAGGGAIHNLSDMTVTGSTISGNSAVEGPIMGTTAVSGAGISNGNNDIRVVRSTISGNFFTADPSITFGAALTSAGASNVDLINSTVSGNTESGPFGGPVYGYGGGTVIADIIGSTIAGNTFDPAARSIDFGGAGSVVTLRGSILGDAAACGDGITAANATYNVDAGGTCPVGTGSVSNADALLGPLTSNGGTTFTRVPAAGSPAIDRLPAAECTDDLAAPLGADQRGAPRPQPAGGACDAGAVELTPATPPAAKKCKKPKKKKKKAGASAKKKKKKCKKKKRRKK